MPEDGLNTGRNMKQACKGSVWNKINLCSVIQNRHVLFSNNHYGMASIKMAPILLVSITEGDERPAASIQKPDRKRRERNYRCHRR